MVSYVAPLAEDFVDRPAWATRQCPLSFLLLYILPSHLCTQFLQAPLLLRHKRYPLGFASNHSYDVLCVQQLSKPHPDCLFGDFFPADPFVLFLRSRRFRAILTQYPPYLLPPPKKGVNNQFHTLSRPLTQGFSSSVDQTKTRTRESEREAQPQIGK